MQSKNLNLKHSCGDMQILHSGRSDISKISMVVISALGGGGGWIIPIRTPDICGPCDASLRNIRLINTDWFGGSHEKNYSE